MMLQLFLFTIKNKIVYRLTRNDSNYLVVTSSKNSVYNQIDD